MKHNRFIPAALALLCATGLYAEHYKVITPVPADTKGMPAPLVNFDSGDTIATVTIGKETALFEGETGEPVLARVLVEGQRLPVFILEPGTVSFNLAEGTAFGSMLNDEMRALKGRIQAIGSEYETAATDEQKDRVYARYNAMLDSTMTANADNVFGYYVFLNGDAGQLDAQALREQFAKYPSFAGYERSRKMLAMAEKREATQPGKKFVDFEVRQPDGTVARLSDYAGKGKYTLVDFWASWCGPCIRQAKVLKEIYAKYKDSGKLDVVGVAVWDDPEATKGAIERHGLPWPNIIDAQAVPTDLYGITGIPCILLIGPDGTILSRDKQGDELRADVDAALAR